MTVWLGPEAAPQTYPVEVRAAQPWHVWTGAHHRGLGGRTQTVWTGQAADAGQRFTVRVPVADVEGLRTMLHTPGRIAVTSDEEGCPIEAGTGVVESTRVTWLYDIKPPAADIEVELAWAT